MKLYFLGTGTSQGSPIIGLNHPVCKSTDSRDKRLRSSVWIFWQDCSIVIDCGPDFRQQMLTSNCSKVDAILFTHEHADHTSGIDDIRPLNSARGAMPIYAHQRVIANLQKRFDYVFETVNRYVGAPTVQTNCVVNNVPFVIGNKEIIPIEAMHGDLQIFGYRIENLVYLTDVKTMAVAELKKLIGVKVLVINALRQELHNTHFNLKEALDFIALVNPKEAYITHISPYLGFHAEVQNSLPKNVYLAYDNLEISI